MERPKVLPLPGNSVREQNFYDEQNQLLGVEWPGNANIVPEERSPSPVATQYMPFTIIDDGGR